MKNRILAIALLLVMVLALPLQAQAALIFEDGARGTWTQLSGDKMKARFTVTNDSSYDTIRAFELYVYATDVWGERIYGEKTIYYWTTKKNVGPGKSVYSDYVTIPDRSDVDKLYVGVKRYVYDDGTIIEYNDWDVDYANWTVTWNK